MIRNLFSKRLDSNCLEIKQVFQMSGVNQTTTVVYRKKVLLVIFIILQKTKCG
jgi:hypothetical protein